MVFELSITGITTLATVTLVGAVITGTTGVLLLARKHDNFIHPNKRKERSH